MKNIFLIPVVLILLYTGSAKAQNPKSYYIEEPKTFVGGLIGGLNFTQVDGDSYKGYHNIGFNTGVVVYTQLVPNIAASLEILFSQKGARSNGSQLSNGGATVITKQNIKLNYAEIPILINFFDKKRNHFGAGLSYAQLINSKEEIVGNNASIKYDPDQYPFKKMDINMILSGQVHVYKGFFAGIRFQYSMLSIRNHVDLEYGRAQQFNNVFALRLMYLFY
jgi:hypothetical protein